MTALFFSLLFILFLLVLIGLYFAPFILALYRNQNIMAVFFINLFAGWTLLGWILAIMLAASDKPTQQVIYMNAPIPNPQLAPTLAITEEPAV
jgi:hypothetical protein